MPWFIFFAISGDFLKKRRRRRGKFLSEIFCFGEDLCEDIFSGGESMALQSHTTNNNHVLQLKVFSYECFFGFSKSFFRFFSTMEINKQNKKAFMFIIIRIFGKVNEVVPGTGRPGRAVRASDLPTEWQALGSILGSLEQRVVGSSLHVLIG